VRRAYFLDQLDDLESEVIRDFADGGFKGKGLLAGVIALANDPRSSLAAGNRTPRLLPTPISATIALRPDLPTLRPTLPRTTATPVPSAARDPTRISVKFEHGPDRSVALRATRSA